MNSNPKLWLATRNLEEKWKKNRISVYLQKPFREKATFNGIENLKISYQVADWNEKDHNASECTTGYIDKKDFFLSANNKW